MATARELLEHADALMRRNRARDAAPVAEMAPAPQPVPVAIVPQPGAPEAARKPVEDDDVPVLTDVVEDFDPISIMGLPDDPVAAAEWPDFDDDDAVVIEGARPLAERTAPVVEDRGAANGGAPSPAPDADGTLATSDAPPPAATQDEAADAEVSTPVGDETTDTGMAATAAAAIETPVHDEPATAVATDHSAAADALALPQADAARWNALAEEVRMQVLQRIDIFTDTGLQEQLAARLQPIVDRASADLVATINHHVGQLMRSYVAEAIEREIDKWRQGGGS